ncbi:hypothetical protein P43SY_002721 [Pythium insidiosum]|uniref:Uncharacterized protein n=1 Tax=Pythium insidiosum TaxID=114742 RepID=A0AAD5LU05_PYTIN|nr:hypothetical protein P43SY_002721 [Pythium insidiosum]
MGHALLDQESSLVLNWRISTLLEILKDIFFAWKKAIDELPSLYSDSSIMGKKQQNKQAASAPQQQQQQQKKGQQQQQQPQKQSAPAPAKEAPVQDKKGGKKGGKK